jgi:hypothetical protein
MYLWIILEDAHHKLPNTLLQRLANRFYKHEMKRKKTDSTVRDHFKSNAPSVETDTTNDLYSRQQTVNTEQIHRSSA